MGEVVVYLLDLAHAPILRALKDSFIAKNV
jgi:hypothetical protein